MKTKYILGLLFFGVLLSAAAQPDTAEKEKRNFDFLIGTWKLESKIDRGQRGTGNNDTFTFKKALDGHAITAEWYFNRGTEDKPEYVNTLYYSAYDTRSKTWSFYYISNISAQYWEGKKEDGVWNFYKSFTIEGQSFIQRQTWISKDHNTLVRSISNSKDNGVTWEEQFVGRFKRSNS